MKPLSRMTNWIWLDGTAPALIKPASPFGSVSVSRDADAVLENIPLPTAVGAADEWDGARSHLRDLLDALRLSERLVTARTPSAAAFLSEPSLL